MNAAEMAQAMWDAKREIDASLAEYERCIHADADADRVAKLAKASAYVSVRAEIAVKMPVAEIEARVDLATADVQHAARMAEGLKRSASQASESKRQWLSALQSLASLTKAEAALARWEPSEVAGV